MAGLELKPNQVLVQHWAGTGIQFNQHVFARFTGVPEVHAPDLEHKVKTLAPHLVRIFYNEQQHGDPVGDGKNQTAAQQDKWASLVRTARLAHDAGAAINVTWQGGQLATGPQREKRMRVFADVLDKLVSAHNPRIRWVTIQNEPNAAPAKKGQVKQVTPERLGAMYRKLDQRLQAKGLRDQIRFMGGDLKEGSADLRSPLNHRHWFEYMSSHMADILDAYSVHIYWDYDNVRRFQHRLVDVRHVVNGLEHRKPVYVTEYGVRSAKRKDEAKRGFCDPGCFVDRKPLGQSLAAAFQHAWFQLQAAELGYAGVIKWDCFYGKYDNSPQAYYAIGPPKKNGWECYPMYHLLHLFTATTEPGWRVLGVQHRPGAESTQHVAAFGGPRNELTLLGLDARDPLLRGASPAVPYSIGGLPPHRTFALMMWNRAGGGQIVHDRNVTADARGNVAFKAPLHSVFALTTRAMPV